MAEHISALRQMRPLRHDGDAGLVLGEVRPAGLVQVQCWPGSRAQAERALEKATGLAPAELNHVAADPQNILMTLGPGRWMLQSMQGDLFADLNDTLPALHATVTDLGHARTVLTVEGRDAARVLNTGLPIDLHPLAFPPGRVAQSLIHHVDVTVRCVVEDCFEVSCMRSFGQALFDTLADAGAPYGVRFDPLHP